MLGTVKWFCDKKGYGFISSEGTEPEIFVHYSEVNKPGFKSLIEGDTVEFDMVKDEKGLKAVNVKIKDRK